MSLDLVYTDGQDIKGFLSENKSMFEEVLLQHAANVRDKIEEIKLVGNINLLGNAVKLVLMVVEERREDVIAFGNQEGIAWAKTSLTLSFKLEWVQAIRKTLWEFLYEYDHFTEDQADRERFFSMENKVNELIDEFFKGFFISYSEYKDKLIEQQTKLVENLSVPIIPVSPNISILPLIGTIDSYRASIIEEKVLFEIGNKRVEILILDLSGIAEMDHEAIQNFLKLLDGVNMMGCRTVITGLSPKIVREIVNMDITFGQKAETKGTLEQAMQDYMKLFDAPKSDIQPDV
ncbi:MULTISPECIES: STAS domain-containing protein [Virgibacillus]|uniref:STAS domain-containing protein n=1 Tax=Virgibacillus TaxID=84406 RepID=UPI0004D104E2|nr:MULTISPECIES: STAS domain-containing protein [Virgibacillus]AIF43727.1 anti-sigma factor antagonist [Virgibacillus sp. SK37]MEC2160334.1 STAS domain-containing protein [Virgibacillus halodenitrificans]